MTLSFTNKAGPIPRLRKWNQTLYLLIKPTSITHILPCLLTPKFDDKNHIRHDDFVKKIDKHPREQLLPQRVHLGVRNYKRFLRCLQVAQDSDQLAPSHAIDDLWHVHLINTPDYEKMCQECFQGRSVHHYIGHVKPGLNMTMKGNFQNFCKLYSQIFREDLTKWSWSWRDVLKGQFRNPLKHSTVIIDW